MNNRMNLLPPVGHKQLQNRSLQRDLSALQIWYWALLEILVPEKPCLDRPVMALLISFSVKALARLRLCCVVCTTHSEGSSFGFDTAKGHARNPVGCKGRGVF